MARNRVQFQTGYGLTQFMDEYGTEEQCREALFRWRWLNGFVCPGCSQTRHCRVQSRAVYQCSGCRHQVSLTAGTILASTKLRLGTGASRNRRLPGAVVFLGARASCPHGPPAGWKPALPGQRRSQPGHCT